LQFRFFDCSFRRQVGYPRNVADLSALQLVDQPGEGINGERFEPVYVRLNPRRAPLMGVVHFLAVVVNEKNVTSINRSKLPDFLQGASGPLVYPINRKINESARYAGDQFIEFNSAA